MMTFRKIAFVALFCTSFLTPPVAADDVTIGDLSARLDDVEKRIRGENPAGDELATKNDVEQLTTLIKDLTGRIEVLEHQVSKASQGKHSVDNQSTVDNHAAEGDHVDDAFAAPAMDAAHPGMVSDSATSSSAGDADVEAVLASLGAETTKPKADAKAIEKGKTEEKRNKATEKAEQTSTSTLDSGSPAAQFNQAKGLFNKGQYAAAEEAFQHYLMAHPTGKEVKSARIHLGEAQLEQGKTNEAKVSFAQAYKENPKGTEGARALLGLAKSLKDKKSTCTVLKKLKSDFPKNAEITEKANELTKQYKCS